MPSELPKFETEPNSEEIRRVLVRALHVAFEKHNALGATGAEVARKNQFGETAMRGDIECEKAVLESFRNDGIPVRVVSEEHGIVDIGGTPKFLAVLDGIDGSGRYANERNTAKYGTMVAIYRGVDPLYSDYITGGIMQHATQRALVGTKGHGAFTISGTQQQRIRTSGHTLLTKETKMYIDEFFELNRKLFSEPLAGFTTVYDKCSSQYYADVAEGLADFALECTRKGNLEIAAAYGLIHEAGGVMVDLDGVDIGNQKYLAFGQKEQLPVITAGTREIADELIAFLRKQRAENS